MITKIETQRDNPVAVSRTGTGKIVARGLLHPGPTETVLVEEIELDREHELIAVASAQMKITLGGIRIERTSTAIGAGRVRERTGDMRQTHELVSRTGMPVVPWRGQPSTNAIAVARPVLGQSDVIEAGLDFERPDVIADRGIGKTVTGQQEAALGQAQTATIQIDATAAAPLDIEIGLLSRPGVVPAHPGQFATHHT
jgi:hypothetical protein